jgi:hypothetical protein
MLVAAVGNYLSYLELQVVRAVYTYLPTVLIWSRIHSSAALERDASVPLRLLTSMNSEPVSTSQRGGSDALSHTKQCPRLRGNKNFFRL